MDRDHDAPLDQPNSPSTKSDMDSSIDLDADAKRVFEVLMKGGLAIIPVGVGYAILAMDEEALEKSFQTKQRGTHKRHAMIGSYKLHKEIHVLPPRQASMTKLLVDDLDLPFGIVAPFKPDHQMIRRLGPALLERSSVDGTLAMLVNGGRLQDEVVRLAYEAGQPVMGSSANLSGKGTKSTVEEIEREILYAADIVINYGKIKHGTIRTSSTMYDFKHMRLIRYGACYDVIQDAFKRFYGMELPDDPGKDALFSGHALESANRY